MKKNIQFLGVFAKNQAEAQNQLIQLCNYSLTQLIKQYQDDKQLEKMFQELKNYKFPNSIHMTSLFVGNNPKQLKHQAFEQFKEGLEQNLVIDAIAISPNNIITAITNHNYEIPLTNQYSHITTLLGKMKPKDSLKVLELVFKSLDYEKMKDVVDADQFWKFEPTKDLQIYVIQLKDKIIIPGVCKID